MSASQKVAALPLALTYPSEGVFKLAVAVHLSSKELALVTTSVGPLEPSVAVLKVVDVGTDVATAVSPCKLALSMH